MPGGHGRNGPVTRGDVPVEGRTSRPEGQQGQQARFRPGRRGRRRPDRTGTVPSGRGKNNDKHSHGSSSIATRCNRSVEMFQRKTRRVLSLLAGTAVLLGATTASQ